MSQSAEPTVAVCCVDRMNEEAAGILNRADALRLFMPDASRQTPEAREVVEQAYDWVKAAERHFKTWPPGDALKLADAYELMHRIAFNLPANTDYVNKIVLQAFRAMLQGDTTVDQYILYKAIETRARRRDPAFLDAPLDWLSRTLAHWHAQAKQRFAAASLTDDDIQSIATILLSADLTPFEGRNQLQFKRTLAAQYLATP